MKDNNKLVNDLKEYLYRKITEETVVQKEALDRNFEIFDKMCELKKAGHSNLSNYEQEINKNNEAFNKADAVIAVLTEIRNFISEYPNE